MTALWAYGVRGCAHWSSCVLQFKNTVRMEENSEMLLDQQQQTRSVDRRGTVLIYSWGRNEDGELAVANNKTANLPTPIRGFRGIAVGVASARTHTAIYNTERQIYMSGSLLFGKIGIPAQVSNFREFHLQEAMLQHRIRKVACGDYHTLALTEQGALFAWGGSLWDKTGSKGKGIHRFDPKDFGNEPILDIACGDFHSLALNAAGQVYSWGGGGQNKNKGQLGHSNKKDLSKPELIQFFKQKKVAKIACGDYHTMVLTRDEELYAFGQGNYGQLGTGGKEDSATPKKVVLNFQVGLEDYFGSGLKAETKVEQLALGGKHSLILTNKGHIYACGYCSQGQLGVNATQNKYEPILVESMLGKRVIMIAAGANHSLCLTDQSNVYSCGYNAKGQLGLGDQRSVTIWTHVTALQAKRTVKIFAGGDHSWAILDEYDPNIRDYEPPSPIKLSIDVTFPNKAEISRQPQQTITQMSTSKKLELILTEVQLSHRFIHFQFRDKLAKNCRTMVDAYLDAVRKTEGQSLKFCKFTPDGEVYDGQGQLTLAGNPRGMTIMMVAELPEDADEYQSCMGAHSKIAIGQILMMDSNMLKVEGQIPSHNFWFFKFATMFEAELKQVRFIEMRPKRR